MVPEADDESRGGGGSTRGVGAVNGGQHRIVDARWRLTGCRSVLRDHVVKDAEDFKGHKKGHWIESAVMQSELARVVMRVALGSGRVDSCMMTAGQLVSGHFRDSRERENESVVNNTVLQEGSPFID